MINTLLEALDRIEHHADAIFVRQEGQNVALSDLPTTKALQWVCRWLRASIIQGIDAVVDTEFTEEETRKRLKATIEDLLNKLD